MKSKIFKLIKKAKVKKYLHKERLLFALFGAIVFILFGTVIPEVYFKYFDKTEYIKVQQPVKTGKELYKPGDDIILTIVRTSYINTHGDVLIELHLINADGLTKYYLSSAHIEVTKSQDQVFYQKYSLPFNIPEGKYFAEAVISYEFKSIPKTYIWRSNSFTVSFDESD